MTCTLRSLSSSLSVSRFSCAFLKERRRRPFCGFIVKFRPVKVVKMRWNLFLSLTTVVQHDGVFSAVLWHFLPNEIQRFANVNSQILTIKTWDSESVNNKYFHFHFLRTDLRVDSDHCRAVQTESDLILRVIKDSWRERCSNPTITNKQEIHKPIPFSLRRIHFMEVALWKMLTGRQLVKNVNTSKWRCHNHDITTREKCEDKAVLDHQCAETSTVTHTKTFTFSSFLSSLSSLFLLSSPPQWRGCRRECGRYLRPREVCQGEGETGTQWPPRAHDAESEREEEVNNNRGEKTKKKQSKASLSRGRWGWCGVKLWTGEGHRESRPPLSADPPPPRPPQSPHWASPSTIPVV